MVGRGLWVCKPRFGKRGRFGVVPALCVLIVSAALLALLFVDSIESWATSMNMNTMVEAQGGIIPPQSVPPTRPEEYLLMPSPLVCQRAKPYLIAMVTSAPANQMARQAIRDTWGGEVEVRGHRVMTLFMVGVASDPGLAKLLIEEARERGDLIQGRFWDSYSNLTLKTLSMLNWARRFCPQAHFLAKVDDDVLFNPGALLRYLNRSTVTNTYEHGDLYLGRVHLHVAPDRDPDSKHYLPRGAYPASVFPDYCSGTAYILSRSALLKISLTAAASPLPTPLPPEDVFVGLCARAAGVLPSHCPLFSGGPAVPYGRCCYQAMVSIHHISPREMLRFWADIHSPPPCSWLGLRASLGVCKVRAMLGTFLGVDQGL
ncbi:beta-1,3-galactosyltransferase 9 [Salmo salar]|uniref:Hexosyltransferase n=1 Tax=Salmo salar TaxID=8030 RepID=A0ABM3CR16_SALSA|nr:beta-1,3-galactosyltransferase 4 [Salmo trutta]XP_029579576.1 beta-1,3-galactosyltransferase 4 [Salmo trutta]XP_045549003.1 beta-1,3-galactosyltransferase 9 [Salmo salar]